MNRRRVVIALVILVIATAGVGLQPAWAQWVVTDPTTTARNAVTAVLKDRLLQTLTLERERQDGIQRIMLDVLDDIPQGFVGAIHAESQGDHFAEHGRGLGIVSQSALVLPQGRGELLPLLEHAAGGKMGHRGQAIFLFFGARTLGRERFDGIVQGLRGRRSGRSVDGGRRCNERPERHQNGQDGVAAHKTNRTLSTVPEM